MKYLSRICAAVACLLLLVTWAMPVAATESNVILDADAKDFVFESDTGAPLSNLFTTFTNVMPGDKLSQTVTVRNDSKMAVTIFLRALESEDAAEELLSQLTLTVNHKTTKLYEAPADQTAQLTNWVSLGVFQPGAEIDLVVTLEVPITVGNEFQGDVGIIGWQFKANEVVPKDPSIPQTGDTMNPAVYMTVMAVSALLIILLILLKRKKKDK